MQFTICAGGSEATVFGSEHRQADDLLTAGLGLAGLRAPLPAVAGAELDAAALRRRAFHSNWNGIAYLGERAGSVLDLLAEPVPGREFHALLWLPGCRQPHRFMLQLPDGFDSQRPRLLVTASSGSRGIYGAVAFPAAWALRRGYAVAHTDRAGGTDWYDVDSRSGPALDGTLTEDPTRLVFNPGVVAAPRHAVLTKHVHSFDHPEARWGAMVNQAHDAAWAVLERLGMAGGPRRSLAAGLSNAGGAILQALQEGGRFEAAVVLAPNVYPPGGRPFLDYLSEAALWMPLAQASIELRDAPSPVPVAAIEAQAEAALQALSELGRCRVRGVTAAARWAYSRLRRHGWSRDTLVAARLPTAFDFWFAGGINYLNSIGGFGPQGHPLGCWFASLDHAGAPRAAAACERQLRWSDSAGIVPGGGVGIVCPPPRSLTLDRLRRLAQGRGSDGRRLAEGLAATLCRPPPRSLPLMLVHGAGDGLIVPAFSSEPYVRLARRNGLELAHWRVPDSAHFDGFLQLPGYGHAWKPLLWSGLAALDAIEQRLEYGVPLPPSPELQN